MDQVLKDVRYNSWMIFLNPHHVGLAMGPDSKMMGSLIGFSIDVLEIAESERVPITLNPSNNVTHIISRNLFFIAEKLDESFIVTFEDDGLEAAIHSKTHSMVQRISLCKQRVVVARNFPSSRCSYHSGVVTTVMAASNHSPGLQLSNSLNTTINQQQGGQNAIECTNTMKKGRGRTTGLGAAKRKKKSATGKLHVDIPIDKMVAVGPGAANFVTEMSIIVLKNAPFNVEKWKNIPEDIFNKIVSKVLDAFDIDNTTHNREVILYTAKRLYRNHRCRFHRHFSQYKTNVIALEHRPDDVGEDDWKFLVTSERNKLNKANQVINHRCGRKSFQAVSYDARDPETQKEPNYQDLWRMTHTNSNGEWINDASKEVHTKVQERCSELLELGYMDEDKDKLTNTAFEAVVGVRSGYSRGLGAGIKPLKGKNIAGLHEELKKEREKRQDIEKNLKDVETQRQQDLKMMEEMTSKIEESQRQHGEKVDKQVEAKVATMLRQMLNIPGGEFSSALDRVS